jgi:hypothetical protein
MSEERYEVIEALWANSNHGTQRRDIEAAYDAGFAAGRCADQPPAPLISSPDKDGGYRITDQPSAVQCPHPTGATWPTDDGGWRCADCGHTDGAAQPDAAHSHKQHETEESVLYKDREWAPRRKSNADKSAEPLNPSD